MFSSRPYFILRNMIFFCLPYNSSIPLEMSEWNHQFESHVNKSLKSLLIVACFLEWSPERKLTDMLTKVKLQLTSKKAWQHHLAAVNIMKESKLAKPGQTRPQSHVRRWLSDSLQATRDRLSCRVLTEICAASGVCLTSEFGWQC